MRWPFASHRERLRREAADWIARLNGPHGEEDRAAFRRWYDASPDHAQAYDRLSSLFQTAGKVRRSEDAVAVGGVPRPRSRPLRYAFAAAAACAVVIAFFLLSARSTMPVAEPRQQVAAFAAEEGEGRRIVLADDSQVLLAAGSRLEVAIGRPERRLRLLRGEARFGVAREARPFIVEANGAEVMARGTVFVVQVAGGRTTVSLIEGRVDVSYPEPGQGRRRRVARLEPGQRLVVEPPGDRAASPAPSASAVAETRPRPSPPAMLEFDDTPLAQAVEQANRHGRPQVRLGGADIAQLRITGAFRAGDTSGFAESVAAVFSLQVERGPDGSLWLRSRPAAIP